MRSTTPAHVSKLGEFDIFVFGSNLAGYHGAGAAYQARMKFGAQPGVGEGYTGRCYAIPTKDGKLEPLPLGSIFMRVRKFIEESQKNPHLQHLVTAIGCGYAGYTPIEIAPAFLQAGFVPQNISLPEEFWKRIDVVLTRK